MRRGFKVLLAMLAAVTVLFPAAAAQAAAPAIPTTAVVVEGAGMGGVSLGSSRAQVEATWGTPTGCYGSAARRSCAYVVGGTTVASVLYVNGIASVLTTQSFGWTTTHGVHTGSAATALSAAYGTALATTDYYHRVLPGSLAGVPTRTTFTMDWWAPYTDQQYFGVLAVTLAYA